MYIKLKNGTIDQYPYTIEQLKNDNKNVSFPENISDDLLVQFEMYPVVEVPPPTYDSITQILVEETPINDNGTWGQVWSVINLSDEDVALNKQISNEQASLNRMDAYRNESDPLFFTWQRGETTEQEWLDKVEEIKQRYQKIGE